MMNRLLSISAFVLSLCAVVVAFFLWREMHGLRSEMSQSSIHARFSDEQLALVKGYSDGVHAEFVEGTVPRKEVLAAEQLSNKARFMHGDISQQEWHRLILTYDPEYPKLIIAHINAGVGSPTDLITYYEDLLESSR